MQEKTLNRKGAILGILIVFLFFFGFSLAVDFPAMCRGSFFSDESTYHSMTYSIAYDGDIEYSREDLFRVFREFRGGPAGIFLKKNLQKDKIFFSKSFIYSLFSSPFVRLLGTKGFFLFHSLLLLLMMYLGFTYLTRYNSPGLSLSFLLTFIFAGTAIVYFFWITPEFFNLSLIFTAYFLWAYKEVKPLEGKISSRWTKFLYSPISDYIASILLGVATFSKPTNALFIAPIGLFNIYRRRWFRTLIVGLIFLGVSAGLFGINYYITGEINYQGGYRKTFLRQFPLIDSKAKFENTGLSMTTNIETYAWSFDIITFLYNLFYYFFGRYSGVVLYFFPAVFSSVLFLIYRPRGLVRWLILGTAVAAILVNIILIPDNYLGGGGTVGNRYFVNIFPLFFFLLPQMRKGRYIFLCWIIAAIFLSQILLNPLQSSLSPAHHGKRYPFKLLPAELSQLNDLPINTNPKARKVALQRPARYWVYFLDDNTYLREAGGFWIRGSSTAEVVLRSEKELERIIVRIKNGQVDNRIKARVGWHSKSLSLKRRAMVDMAFQTGRGFKYGETYLYRVYITSKAGFIPKHYTPAHPDNRYLGCFATFEVQ